MNAQVNTTQEQSKSNGAAEHSTTKPKPRETKAKVEAVAKETSAENAKAIKEHEANVLKTAKTVTGDASKIKGMIVTIRRDKAKLETLMNVCAASCIVHCIVHGNVTPARDFLAALSGGEGRGESGKTPIRVNAYRKFFEIMGPMVMENRGEGMNLYLDKARVAAYKKDYNKDKLKFASNLMRTPAYVVKPEAEFVPFDLTKALNQLYTRAESYETDQAKKLGRPLTAAEKKEINTTGLKELAKVVEKING